MAKLLLLSAAGVVVGAAFLYPTRATGREVPMARLQNIADLRFAELCRRAAA
ncbi:hypothetical protein [Streptomyces sp. SYSU K217416]